LSTIADRLLKAGFENPILLKELPKADQESLATQLNFTWSEKAKFFLAIKSLPEISAPSPVPVKPPHPPMIPAFVSPPVRSQNVPRALPIPTEIPKPKAIKNNIQFKFTFENRHPRGVAVDDENNIIVADQINHDVGVWNYNKNLILKFGSRGKGDGQFQNPIGVAVHNGNIVVVEHGNHRIQFFDRSGRSLKKFGSKGTGNGQFLLPCFICFGPDGKLYVPDFGHPRVQVFDSNGSFLKSFDLGPASRSSGIAISNGFLFISDFGNNCIKVFNSEGVFIRQFGSPGTANGQLTHPIGLDIDVDGNCVVADSANQRVQIFNSEGEFVTKFGSEGPADQRLSGPYGVAIGKDGDIIVSDVVCQSVKVFGWN